MNKWIVAFLTSVLVLGCDSTQKDVESWMGAPRSELLSRWGVPDAEADIGDGNQLVTYKLPWGSYGQYGGGNHVGIVTFTLSASGTVVSWSYRDCQAGSYPRRGG